MPLVKSGSKETKNIWTTRSSLETARTYESSPVNRVKITESFLALVALLGCALFLGGCGPGGGSGSGTDPQAVQSYGSGAGASVRQKQADFLNRIRQSDPNFQTVQEAVLNQNNDLGLILNRNVPLDSIPQLMRAMLTRMAQEFPGQDLTIIAYAPTQPPKRIGTAHLDSRSRQMTYTPEHPSNNQ
jgi:hypothetical protein